MSATDRRIETAKEQAATRQAERHGNMGNHTNHAKALASSQVAADHIREQPNMVASPQAPAQVVRNPFHRYRASVWWTRFFDMEEI